MSRMFAGVLWLVAMIWAGAAVAAETWTMVTAYPPDSFQTKNDQAFAAGVARATIGRVQIQVRANGSLVKGPGIREAVTAGLTRIERGTKQNPLVQEVPVQLGERLLSADMAGDPLLGFDSVPFLAGSYEAAEKLWQAARPRVEALLEEQNLVLLYSVPWPPQGLFTQQPMGEDGFEGLALRSTDATTDALIRLVGARPEPVPVGEVEERLADGTIQGFIASAATGYADEIWNLASYFYDLQAWLPRSYVFVNRQAWEALPETLQGLIRDEAAKAEVRGATDAKALSAWYLDQLRQKGMTVVSPTPELQARLATYGEAQLADWLERTGPAGREIVDRYRAM